MAMHSLLRSGSPGTRNDGAFATLRKPRGVLGLMCSGPRDQQFPDKEKLQEVGFGGLGNSAYKLK